MGLSNWVYICGLMQFGMVGYLYRNVCSNLYIILLNYFDKMLVLLICQEYLW